MDLQLSGMNAYQQKRQQLFDELASLQGSEPLSLKKSTSNLFRNRNSTKKSIDVRSFNRVIDVNTKEQYADVEGMATYETIVDATLAHGFLPTVVPELKTITLGGALSGVGIESSSFRYGLVHETVLEFDVLLGDGKIVTCTPHNEHSDLFFAFANSYGSFGYALRVRVKIIPAKKFIKLTHKRFDNSKDYFEAMHKLCLDNRKQGDYAFIDGTAFSNKEMYITLAEFVDVAPKISNYKYMNVYYRSIQKKQADYLTTLDYIWRWDTDWFWCSRFFGMQKFLPRLLLGKFLLKSKSYWKIMRFSRNNSIAKFCEKIFCKPDETVIQDIEIPIKNSAAFLEFFFKEIPIEPIWICPLYAYNEDAHFSFYDLPKNELLINFGFWQAVKQKNEDGYYNKLIEAKVTSLSGYKSLYSNVYYSEQEFWTIYNKARYDKLKQKYDPQNGLKNLYTKVTEK
jgi:FAD/FMN-containing dehydrogenase